MVFAADYKATCYWQDDVSALPEASHTLPQHVDVLIVGSGYTGLSAARETALAGRSTTSPAAIWLTRVEGRRRNIAPQFTASGFGKDTGG